ncbi:hypothetical protein PMAYCL1PPCAC_30675, partial [Pristionchus mayeri]
CDCAAVTDSVASNPPMRLHHYRWVLDAIGMHRGPRPILDLVFERRYGLFFARWEDDSDARGFATNGVKTHYHLHLSRRTRRASEGRFHLTPFLFFFSSPSW